MSTDIRRCRRALNQWTDCFPLTSPSSLSSFLVGGLLERMQSARGRPHAIKSPGPGFEHELLGLFLVIRLEIGLCEVK